MKNGRKSTGSVLNTKARVRKPGSSAVVTPRGHAGEEIEGLVQSVNAPSLVVLDNRLGTVMVKTDATRFDRISYLQVLEQGLKVMDATAISLCMDNRLPIVVFNLRTPGNIKRAITG